MFDDPFVFFALVIAIVALIIRAEGHEPGGGAAPAPGGDPGDAGGRRCARASAAHAI